MNHEPAAHTSRTFAVGQLPSGGSIDVVEHTYRGAEGPTVSVIAGQHGIELNGTAVARRLGDRLSTMSIAGTVRVLPVANPPAMDHRSYMGPAAYDVVNPNLNRVWPGDSDGTLTERIAAYLWDRLADSDAIVDLHSGTPEMLTHVRYCDDGTTADRLATAFGVAHLLVDEPPKSDPPRTTLRNAASQAEIPALTVELANSREVATEAVAAGLEGVTNVLKTMGMVPGDIENTPTQQVLRDDIPAVCLSSAGLFEPASRVTVGDHVQVGTVLGTVHNPETFELVETITADRSGFVYSLSRGGANAAGERVASLASRASTADTEQD
ncbi:succinylglutamate desuccinylase/aspartoacylase family protein [Halalkalirubrum salinum]|uniref:succinylglutamate desuccinylase/aspartoacylase family protein n=1 Tax=Halalkalirubrum salinum TaxID=2563889 RepID=UPI0014852BE9|nr:succinylglutamate desuccinylase/aspartoacylase family protein [Halalkalirubrum salinum]